jgi:4,5-DOPA dioxygenase extradiol
MTLDALRTLRTGPENPEILPALFLGHGNPMNAITNNEFARTWRHVGESLPKPAAVLCISAHWETPGVFVTAMEKPRTIHDFGGFPRELYEVQYPAPGSPDLAEATRQMVKGSSVELDHKWGLDHGCWSVLKHLFPNADVPVVQMSLDHTKPATWHYDLAAELNRLRKRGILIVGSGNMVHNLGRADWQKREGFDWALEADARLKTLISEKNHKALTNYETLGAEVGLAVPTPEHYLPLLYILALQREGDGVLFFNEKTELGSISMTSVKIG